MVSFYPYDILCFINFIIPTKKLFTWLFARSYSLEVYGKFPPYSTVNML